MHTESDTTLKKIIHHNQVEFIAGIWGCFNVVNPLTSYAILVSVGEKGHIAILTDT